MTLVPWGEVRGAQPARSGPLAPLANQLRRGACQLRRANPGLFRSPLLQPNPVSLRRQYTNQDIWENICDDFPLPAPDLLDIPFGGGRCPTLYRVNAYVYLTNGQRASDFEDNIQGPLQAIRWVIVDTSATQRSWSIQIVDANGSVRTNSVFSGNPNQYARKEIEVIRKDGQPDDCPEPPDPDPPVITQITNNFPVEVTFGDQILNLPISFNDYSVNNEGDVTWSPNFRLGDINFQIQGDGIKIDLDPNFSLAPEVNVNLGTGNVGGAIGSILNSVPQLLDLLSEILDLINSGQGGECDLTPLANYLRCLIERPDREIQSSSLVANSTGGDFPLSPGRIAVRIQRTGDLQPGTPVQSGSGGLPNVNFWGWYSVGDGGYFSERTPLSYDLTFVPVEKSVTSIRINPTFGNTFSASEIVETNICTFPT